ncbi:MAG: DegT/DnrJ/EryC1/StrS family aminotransferase [Magnetococcales bacterium]|nr:DegT/DnrJ/EryC1/StrS family aminotransferase [Magnetococcales bacterium]
MICMNNFKAEPPQLRQAMLAAVGRVMDSGRYILGQELHRFEQLWATRCAVPFGVGVGDGLHAIEIALRALDIGPGDEVITTPMTAFATVLAILKAGAQPVLADIEADTALLSLESVRRCLSPRTRAVLLVHLYGQVNRMQAWLDLCKAHHITLIEDCAQAHLAHWQGRPVGSFGRVGAFSFYPTKNLGAIGDAGMLVTTDASLANRASQLRNYGQEETGHFTELGTNSRLDEMQAAILSERLHWLPAFTEARRTIAQAYRAGIHHAAIQMLSEPADPASHVYHLFVVTCENRGALQAHLTRQGIQSIIHYPIPIHRQASCGDLPRDPLGLSNSERHAERCLSLPCHPMMEPEEIDAVIKAVNSF